MPAAEGSAVEQAVGLKGGQTYSRSFYIPYDKVDPEVIKEARRNMVSYLTPVVARARAKKDRNYRIHTTAAFTSTYDVIVTGVVVVEPKNHRKEEI